MDFQLNEKQKAAVEHEGAPLLIIAGAGTGKTMVITERIKWLISERNIDPENILALTFTEKAAGEMEERVDKALPLGYSRLWIVTFHGFCERVLRQEAVHIGLDPGFNILSEAEVQLFVRKNLFEFDLKYFRPHGNPTKFISGMITHFSRLRDENVTADQYVEFATSKKNLADIQTLTDEEKVELEQLQELAGAYKKYEELKIEHSVMDFADLIANSIKLFESRPNILKQYKKQFPHILIDEFQDTNYAQNYLAMMLAGDGQNLTVVADDDQSIYRWRGAAVYNVLDFKEQYENAEIKTLVDNYRSDQRILDASYELIQNNNPDRLEVSANINKSLQAHKEFSTKDPLRFVWEETAENEANTVAKEIKNAMERSEIDSYADAAVLVRANNHAESFVQAFAQAGIPFQFLGPGKLYKQAEIRDLVAYLHILTDFDDSASVLRVLTSQTFSVPGRHITWLNTEAKKNHISVLRQLELVAEMPEEYEHGIDENTMKRLRWFITMVHRHQDLAYKATAGEVLYYFLEDTGMLQKMIDPKTEREAKQIENISAFFNRIKSFEVLNPESKLVDFVEYMDFMYEAGDSPLASETDWSGSNAVNILTVHASKGLEFDMVFVANCVDQRFPSRSRKDQIPLHPELIKEPEPVNDPHVAEERRLFYVAITRARKILYLTGAKYYHEGKREKKMSPFIGEAYGENLDSLLVESSSVIKSPSLFDLSQFAKTDEPKEESPLKLEHQKVTYLSHSQISTFDTCPLHYKLDYLLKIPKLPSSALAFGDVVHKTLNDVYGLIKAGELSRNVVDVLESMNHIYEQHWTPVGFVHKKQAFERFEEGRVMLETFVRQDLDREFEIEHLEEAFTVSIAEDLKLGGRIDRIDRLPDGSLEILDYKTGKMPKMRELEKGMKGLQLSIYAIAVTNPSLYKYLLEDVKLSFYYLEDGERVTLTRTREDLEEAKEKILEVRDQIEQSDFECNHSFICTNGCEYGLFCNN